MRVDCNRQLWKGTVSMIGSKAVWWMMLVGSPLIGSLISGDDETASDLYGRGVHAYFAGQYDRAIECLTGAIKKRPTDPRCYYFRGLAAARLHGEQAGTADFAKGADIEVNGADKHYEVNSSLQREQGALRLVIERHRDAARTAGVQRQAKRNRARYEARQRREEIVLFKPDQPAPKADVPLPEPNLQGIEDPFTSGVALTGGMEVKSADADTQQPPEDTTTAPKTAPATDPFAKPAPADAAMPKDPFTAPGDAPVAEKPDPEMPAAQPDPFADPSKPPADEMPPDQTPKTDTGEPATPPGATGGSLLDVLGKTLSGKNSNRDPFGDQPADDAAKQEETKPPAKEDSSADPFANPPAKQEPQPPAKEETTGDPFADPPAKQEPRPPAKTDGDAAGKKTEPKGEDPFR